MNWTREPISGEYKSDCGRFTCRKSPGGMWYVFDSMRRDRSGNPKLVATLTTLKEAQELAEEESEWGPLGENLSPAWPQW